MKYSNVTKVIIDIQNTVQRGALRRASLSRLTTVGVVDFGKTNSLV